MKRLLLSLLSLLFACGCARSQVERIEWQTMGTIAAVQWKGASFATPPTALIESVKATFSAVERLLNAHNPESELSRLAPCEDEEILRRCDPLVRPCYEAAFALRNETDRVFNPRWKGAKTMDLGGIAKGFAVDLAARRLAPLVSEGNDVLIDLGGNLKAVRGDWSTAIAVPDGHPPVVFFLKEGDSCATSGEYYRGHHIRDGRTGEAIREEAFSVTVRHPSSAMLADGLSTVLFILGREKGERFLKARHPQAEATWTTN